MKLLIVVVGIIFGPLIILGIAKIISTMSGTVKKTNPFKYVVFLKPKKLIMLAILGAIVCGIYLLTCWLWPTPEKLAFKELSKNLAELELQPEKERLKKFADKVNNGEMLTEKEKRQAMKDKEKIETVRKEYSKGNLTSPPKQVSAKPEEETWPWTFEWVRSEAQWEVVKKLGRKKKGEKYPANILKITPSELIMEYVSGYSGKPEKVVLKIGNTGDFYATDYYVKSKKPKEIDLSLKVSLKKDHESPGNFVGTFWQDQDNQQVDCWLSKK